jgi:replicative DNA helicase
MREPECVDLVLDVITSPDVFSVGIHQTIWRAVLNLYDRQVPSDITTVAEELVKMQALDDVGGRVYLIELVGGSVTTANVVEHANIIVEKARLRKMAMELTAAVEEAVDGQLESSELVERVDNIVSGAVEERKVEVFSAGLLVADYIMELTSPQKQFGKEAYLETRIGALNGQITGLFKEDMTIIAGPPSMGKSSLALDIAVWNTMLGKSTLYFALDERLAAMKQRLLTSATGITNARLYQGRFTEAEIGAMTEAMGRYLQNDRTFLTSRTDMSVVDIRAVSRRHKRRYGLDAIIVDYVQLLRPHRDFERRDLEVAEQSRLLKALAKELEVAVIVVSQLNRDYSKLPFNPAKGLYGFPQPSQLRDSGALEQEANIILFTWNVLRAFMLHGFSQDTAEYRKEKNYFLDGVERAFIVVAKNKLGPPAVVECRWDPKRMVFYSVESSSGGGQGYDDDAPF